MSAFKYLVFVIGVVLVAAYGAILTEFINPFLGQTDAQSTSEASAKGLEWANAFFDWFALLALALLVFALIVGVVNRRNQVRI